MFKFLRKSRKSVSDRDGAAPLLPKDGGEGPISGVYSPTNPEFHSKGGFSGDQYQKTQMLAVRQLRNDFWVMEATLFTEIKELRRKLFQSSINAQKRHAELTDILDKILQKLTVCYKINFELLQKLEQMEEKLSMIQYKNY